MKTIHNMNKVYSMALILSLFLSACAAANAVQPPAIAPGQVIPVYPGTVVWGIKQAMQGAPGSAVMTDGQSLMVKWVNGEYPGVTWWWCMGKSAEITRWGNIANSTDFKSLEEILKEHGWKVLAAAEAKQILTTALTMLGRAANSLPIPVFVVMPEGRHIIPQNEPQIE